ncbi:hypothetical protein Tco_0956948 [Tanacetum coccineum]
MALEERTVEFDEGQTGSNPGKTPESRPPPKLELKEEDQAGSDPGQSHVAQAGPNHCNNAQKHSLTISFTQKEPGKANVETELNPLVTVPIRQASSSVPPLSTPIINLSPPKPVSHPDHITLYEALEVFMQRENNDELHASLTKSRKRRRDDQDPPPPPPKDSDRSKKKKHDYDVSASKQPLVQKSSAWKTSNLREALPVLHA